MTGSDKLPKMGINGNKGIHFTFANGFTLSVQIGPGNYCENRDLLGYEQFHRMRNGHALPASHTAEIAVWPANGEMIPLVMDTVYGWFPISELPWLMLAVGAPDATAESIAHFVKGVDNAE